MSAAQISALLEEAKHLETTIHPRKASKRIIRAACLQIIADPKSKPRELLRAANILQQLIRNEQFRLTYRTHPLKPGRPSKKRVKVDTKVCVDGILEQVTSSTGRQHNVEFEHESA